MNYQTYLKKTSGIVAIMLTLAMSFSPSLVHAVTFDAGHGQASGAPGAGQNHTFNFNLPVALSTNAEIQLQFAGTGSEGSMTDNEQFIKDSGLDYTDIDVSIGGVNKTLAATPNGQTLGVTVDTAGGEGVFVFINASATYTGNSISDAVVIKIGTNATGGDKQIINPVATGTALVRAAIFTDKVQSDLSDADTNTTSESMSIAASVPEVGTVVLFGASIIGLWFMMNEMKKHQSSGFAV